MHKTTLVKYALGPTLCLGMALALLLWWQGMALTYAYLLGASAATLLLYGYDKRQAVAGGTRVPEVALHIAALLGGSPGALAGQMLFRHKTRKRRFQIVFATVVLFQIALVYGYFRFAQGRLQ